MLKKTETQEINPAKKPSGIMAMGELLANTADGINEQIEELQKRRIAKEIAQKDILLGITSTLESVNKFFMVDLQAIDSDIAALERLRDGKPEAQE